MASFLTPTAEYGQFAKQYYAGLDAAQQARLKEEEAQRAARDQALREQVTAENIRLGRSQEGRAAAQENRQAAAFAEQQRQAAADRALAMSLAQAPTRTEGAYTPTQLLPTREVRPSVGITAPATGASDVFLSMTPGGVFVTPPGGRPQMMKLGAGDVAPPAIAVSKSWMPQSEAVRTAYLEALKQSPSAAYTTGLVIGQFPRAIGGVAADIVNPLLNLGASAAGVGADVLRGAFGVAPVSPAQLAAQDEADETRRAQIAGVAVPSFAEAQFNAQSGVGVSMGVRSPTEQTLNAPVGQEQPPNLTDLSIDPLVINRARSQAEAEKRLLQKQLTAAAEAKKFDVIAALNTKLAALESNDLAFDAQDAIISILRGDPDPLNNVVQRMTYGEGAIQPRSDGLYDIVNLRNPSQSLEGLTTGQLVIQVRKGTDAAWNEQYQNKVAEVQKKQADLRMKEFESALKTAESITIERAKAEADRQGLLLQNMGDGTLAVVDKDTGSLSVLTLEEQKVGGVTKTVPKLTPITPVPIQ